MWQCGSFIATKQYQKAILFTMSMAIVLITVTKTLSAFRVANILKCTLNKGEAFRLLQSNLHILKASDRLQKHGTQAKKGKNGILAILKSVTTRYLKKAKAFARFARSSLNTESLVETPTLAVCLATQNGIGSTLETLPPIAHFVEMNSLQRKPTHNLRTEKLVLQNVSENLELKTIQSSIRKVYSLTVKDYGVYYVNGILVSNCDTLYDACKIALIDKTLYNQEKSDKRQEALNSIAFSTDQRINAIRGSSPWQSHAR